MDHTSSTARDIRYQIYPSLLDAYDGYLYSDDIWETYWGGSDSLPHTSEEFRERQLADLLAKINREPRERSLKADIGTVFNHLVDYTLTGERPEGLTAERVKDAQGATTGVRATYDGYTFEYPLSMLEAFVQLYKPEQAIPQMLVEGTIDTTLGTVRLYGYVDELTSDAICDIKTTGAYKPWKFRGNAQHLVYTYCLRQMGYAIDTFHYDVAHIRSQIDEASRQVVVSLSGQYRETYQWHGESEDHLRTRLESFIEFLESYSHLITDRKVFGGNNQ